jgi:hypothetical protein
MPKIQVLHDIGTIVGCIYTDGKTFIGKIIKIEAVKTMSKELKENEKPNKDITITYTVQVGKELFNMKEEEIKVYEIKE